MKIRTNNGSSYTLDDKERDNEKLEGKKFLLLADVTTGYRNGR